MTTINNHQNPGFAAKFNDTRQFLSIRVGTIVEARYDKNQPGPPPPDNETRYWHNMDVNRNYRGPLYRVQFGKKWDGNPELTYWMPQLQLRASQDQDYWAYEVGEQVLCVCVSGDPMQTVIFGALPCDSYRPPVGDDDITHDKRPWRPSVHRRRYKDNMLWEYDRYLHRELMVFQDGTKHTRWLLDDRTDRSGRVKETNSDKVGVPPRHLDRIQYADGSIDEFLWDEDSGEHQFTRLLPDGNKHILLYNDKTGVHRSNKFESDGTLTEHVDGDGHQWQKQFPDGTRIKYDLDTGELLVRNAVGNTVIEVANGDLNATVNNHITITANGNISVTSSGDIAINADGDINLKCGDGKKVNITGNLNVSGVSKAAAHI